MADRSVRVILRANVADFKANMESASKSTDRLADALGGAEKVSVTTMGRMGQSLRVHRESWDAVGSAALRFGAGMAVALGGATKATIDWESAWTGVKKTVDGTPEQMAALEGSLRQMTHVLPASHAEIAGVAEAAGQLGIQTGNVASFTKTMIDLGEATNLSADQAATALARFANIMGTSQSKFSNVGSAVVELGNNFATTEAEIVDMAMRLASAGRQAGLTEGEVLGLATALSSVGIESEAGGTAMSRVMIEMRKAVDTAGPKLEAFARVAGMTGEQFKTAFQQDAGGAVTAFIEGLGRMDKAGQSVQPVLEQLGMTDVRVGNALRSAASASDLFADAMRTGNQAFGENVALANEAEQRYQTAASRIAMAWNQIKDAAISVGSALAPIVTFVAEVVGGLADAFGSLPQPILGAVGAIGGLVGAASLIGGVFLKGAGKVMDFTNHLANLGSIAPGTASKITGVMGAIGKWGPAVGVALAGVGWIIGEYQRNAAEAAQTTEEFANALKESGGAIDESVRAIAAQKIVDSGVAEVYKRMGGDVRDLTTALTAVGPAADDARARIEAIIEGTRTKTKNMRGGGFSQLSEDATTVKQKMEELTGQMGDAIEKYQLTGEAAAEAGGAQRELAGATGETADAYDRQREAMEGAMSKLREMYGITKDKITAESDWQASLAAATEALKQNGSTLDQSTEAGRKNWQVLLNMADAALTQAEANYKAGDGIDTVTAKLEGQREKFIEQAMNFEMTRAEAEAYADQLGLIPSQVATSVEANVNPALKQLDGLLTQIDQSGESVSIGGNTVTAESSLDELLQLVHLSREDIGIDANTSEGIKTVGDYLAWARQQRADTNVGANTNDAHSAFSRFKTLVSNGVSVPVKPTGLQAARSAIATVLGGPIGIAMHVAATRGFATGGYVGRFAHGGTPAPSRRTGRIVGPGGPRDDKIPAWLSNGEFVMNARAVQHYGLQHMYALNAMRLATGGPAGHQHAKRPRQFEATHNGPVFKQTVTQHIATLSVVPDSEFVSENAAKARALMGGVR